MKKKTLAILFLGFMGLKSVANPVSPEEARQVAERFFRNLGAEDGTSMDVRRSPVALRSSRPGGSPYYICAPRSGSGFVVVSGDDALPPVVGYSLDAPVAGKELPPQLEGFLSAYSAYVDVTRQGGVSVPEARGTAAAYEAVSPLLTTKWGAGLPLQRALSGLRQRPRGGGLRGGGHGANHELPPLARTRERGGGRYGPVHACV